MAMKSLAKQTAVYGLSNILGKFLNWCLVPFYTYVLTSSAEYGIVTNLYAWTALLLVILTYGMETGFFRFANKEGADAPSVYATSMGSVGLTSLVFAVLICVLSPTISSLLGYGGHSEYIAMMGVIVAIDAFDCIPFAWLRYEGKAGRFAILKFLMVLVNVVCNIFFLYLCPKIHQSSPELISWFYSPDYSVGYVFVSNFISTLFVTAMLVPDIRKAGKFSSSLLKSILRYSLPLLLLGIAGIMNQTIDKILFPYLYPNPEEAQTQLGIYGACFKVAMVMMVFTQAFRYAYEPFVFAQSRNNGEVDKDKEYSLAMKFYVIFSCLIFLGITFYIDILKYLIREDYWDGLNVVPIILISYLFQGVYFNLSLWYKLSDKTYWGAVLSSIGLVITIAVNVALVPVMSYTASATASLLCYFVIMIISYVLGQKHYPIKYDLKSCFLYFALSLGLYAVSYSFSNTLSEANLVWVSMIFNTFLISIFVIVILKRDLPLSSILKRRKRQA